MISGVTKTGFQYNLEEGVLDDYELLEDLAAVDRGETAFIISVVDRLLGDTQKAGLKNHIRGENGRVTTSGMVAEVLEILQSAGQGNS